MPIDDAQLAAFAAGQLKAEDSELIRAELARDTALRHRFDQITSVASTTAQAPNRRPFGILAVGAAIAAIGLSWWQWHAPATFIIPTAEKVALNHLASGESETLDDGRQLGMISSYLNPPGELCREYETHSGPLMRISIACRGQNGWTEKIAVTVMARGELLEPVSGGLHTLEAYRGDAKLSNRLEPAAEAALLEAQ